MQKASTLVRQDWTPTNLMGLQRALRKAYASVADACDPRRHAFYGTRNRAYGVGYARWLAIDFYLKEACDAGWLPGITAEWISLGGKGGLFAMELRGLYTSVLAIHLQDLDETPRESDYRYDKRVSNERYPLLAGFEEMEAPSQLLSLLLVHGDKNAEFAELRAYDDPRNRASYTPFTGNLMEGAPLPVGDDSEAVAEPNVALIKPAEQQTKPSDGV